MDVDVKDILLKALFLLLLEMKDDILTQRIIYLFKFKKIVL